MMGSWYDFTSKYGFGDGEQLEDIDFAARDLIVERLNQLPEFKSRRIRAVAYDRDGLHNSCLIVLLPAVDGKSDAELLQLWEDRKIDEVALPDCNTDDFDDGNFWDIRDIISEAYASAWQIQCGKAVANVDWELLYQQKMKLIELAAGQNDASATDALEGIINFLDALQDEAETRGLFHHPLAGVAGKEGK